MNIIIVCTSTKTFSQMMSWEPSKLKIRKTTETNMMPEVTANTTLNLEKNIIQELLLLVVDIGSSIVRRLQWKMTTKKKSPPVHKIHPKPLSMMLEFKKKYEIHIILHYFPSISYYFHIPKSFLNFFPHTGKNRNRRKSNLLP